MSSEQLLLIGSQEWRLQRFFQTQLSTKPFLSGTSLVETPAQQQLPGRYQAATEAFLKKSSVAGVVAKARRPRRETTTRLQNDPAVALPEAAITAGGVASKALNVAGKFALAAAVVVDSYRLGKAVYEDIKEQDTLGKRTAKTSASVASGWAGGLAGAAAGNSAGAVIGGTIGAAFGGIGAVPGAAVGSLVGCLVGGVTGGVGASMAAENIVDLINKDEMRGHIFVLDGQHLCIKPSSQPENEAQDDEWLEIVKLVVTVALLRKRIDLVAKQPLTEVLSYEALDEIGVPADAVRASRVRAGQDLLREICGTPQFYCSFLLLVVCKSASVEEDVSKLDRLALDEVGNELLCMTDAGFALVWFNPESGVESTLETLKPHFPYLEIFRN